ncbi:hypothetical protein [Nonomuraea sp. NPDC049480]
MTSHEDLEAIPWSSDGLVYRPLHLKRRPAEMDDDQITTIG